MSPSSEQVLREVLTISYQAATRGIVNGLLFAGLSIAAMWPHIPEVFLLTWAAVFALIAALRILIARAFFAAQPQDAELTRWVRYAALGYAATGLAWGILGCAALHFAPGEPVYLLWVWFLIAFFSVLSAQRAGAHPLVFKSFVFAAMLPLIAFSLVSPGPYYPLGILAELLIIVMALLVGRSGNSYVQDSIRMRFENLELLKDLTRQKEELDRANTAKTRFLAAASHDLRQPMQAVVLLVESLRERVTDPETRRIVRNIRSSVTSMSALLNAILDVSRFDAGAVKPSRRHFRVSDVLERLLSTYSHDAAARRLEMRMVKSSAIVETDPELLFRILANITTNALRHTERGTVLVGCRRRPDGLSIEVRDTGPGIPEHELENIFKEFYQLGNPHRDREQGLGLGLAIVERTAKLLGHPLAVRSAPGHGSTFSVLVPYGIEENIDAGAPAREELASLKGCTVLVVEDEKDVRAAMTILLESWGCETLVASSGSEALSMVGGPTIAPDVVVADYRLPGGANGIELIGAVRKIHPRTAGIVISGDIGAPVLREAEGLGLRLLHKPVRPARLRALLGNMWRERSPAPRPAARDATPAP